MYDRVKDLNKDLNRLIREIIDSGGGIHLVSKEHPEFSIKLTDEVKIMYFVPVVQKQWEVTEQ